MEPLTKEGDVYQGYCLRCHDVHGLRQLLHDNDIPLDLPQNKRTPVVPGGFAGGEGGLNNTALRLINDNDLITRNLENQSSELKGFCSN